MSLVLLSRHAKEGITIRLITDNKGVKDNFDGGEKITCKSANSDLYHELFKPIHKKKLSLSAAWMPSHLKDPSCKKERPEWVTDRDIHGNSCADDLCGEAAKEYMVGPETSSNCIYYYKLVKAVQ